ncbi:Methylsterol monooxygenase 2-2 [Porphyridium purpureum]|uniref:Methylsterol monooxygenase 2-2 n=1 Tax=Porphyridium purpureum TaxID=35688 RepID=A0A5J4Z2G7_PORPP|nr:Methylsterol monooxygenase 2-2 [Porphyridium purpureum]|eukprot:POR1223..scf208_2
MAEVPGLQEAWGTLVENVPAWQLRSFGTFVLHEMFYWGSYLPFFVMDRTPYFHKWKIQDEKENDLPGQWQCFKAVMLNHMLVVFPIVMVSHLFEFLGVDAGYEVPSLITIAFQVFVCFLIEDFCFYWGHRALHTDFLYRHIHSVHHTYSAPFGIAAEYAHPLEVIFLGLSTIFGPIICRPHLLTLWVYLFFRCLQTVECHSGYDFPWSLNRWLPFYGGADFHDHHHKSYSGNYASVFIWTDYIYGTDTSYRQWKSKMAADEKKLASADCAPTDSAAKRST